MAMDGVSIAGIVYELKKRITGGRIYKIYQPEDDEICLVIKNKTDEGNTSDRLVISANAGMPMVYISDKTKDNPSVAPNFCMLLRKHIGNGRIKDIRQPDFERIIEIDIEHLDEMGDLCTKRLIVEIMGKHSNIIFVDDDGVIIDSIKHISHAVSSVREVLPGRKYTYPPDKEKISPIALDVNYFINHVMTKPENVAKAVYTSYKGISPAIANEIIYRSGIDKDNTDALSLLEKENIYNVFNELMRDVQNGEFEPCIAFDGYEPKEFSSVRLTSYGDKNLEGNNPSKNAKGLKLYDSISAVIEEYYSKKSVASRMKQRSTDLRKIVANAVERTSKKYDLQRAQLKDTEKRDKYKIYGELLTTYGYDAKPGDKELICDNYYTGEKITIPLKTDKTAMECAKEYFDRYNKLKRTFDALSRLTEETKRELMYLLSVKNSLEIVTSEGDLKQIKDELIESGYIKGRVSKKGEKNQSKSKPLHYISSEGFDIYVGKNNYQNEEVSFKIASPEDMWFHAKNISGSHVVVKTNGIKDLPDIVYEEAARLAAYYSSGRENGKVEIDYTERRNLKKPPKANPGYVIYHTNYSMSIEPDINGIKEIDQ